MKTLYKFTFAFILTVLSFGTMVSQDIMEVPPGENSDALYYVISGDTLPNGDRANLNRIYRLERGQNYLMAATLNANYPVKLIAGGDESLRPPMVIAGQFSDGTNIRPFFTLNGDNDRHLFKDIFFNGVDLNREYLGFTSAVVANGDGQSLTYEGCIFNAFTGGATRFEGADNKIYIRDCEWRNGVSATHMFIGQQVTFPALPVDTMVITNNTFFNNNAFWLFQENGLSRFQVIEHNTIFTNLVDPMRLRFASNTNIRSNLFYGTLAYGDSEEFRDLTVYEPDGAPTSIISIYETPSEILAAEGWTEADRTINVSHNAYFTPDPIKAYWESNSEVDDDIVWMNTRTQALFDDNEGHPNLSVNNNYNMDPNFTDQVAHDFVVNGVADFCETYRETLTPGEPLSGDAGSVRNYDAAGGVDILIEIAWPLPEKLGYSNSTLLSGGHDDLPVGDLNWHDGQRELYEEPGQIDVVGTKEVISTNFEIAPNPANSELTITSPDEIQKIEVYNLSGKLVSVNYTNQREKTIDISNLRNGIYIVKVHSKEYISANRFVKI